MKLVTRLAAFTVAGLLMIPQPSSAMVDPASVMAAASTAKEVATKSQEFLQFIGYMPTEPNPLARLPEQLDAMQASLDRIEGTVEEVRDIVRRMENAAVKAANEESLNRYLDALQYVTAARISLVYLAQNPTDANILRDADVASRLAITEFEQRPAIFRAAGPYVTDERFFHVLAYPGYLTAIAVRLAFIQAAYGKTGFIKAPYRGELMATATKLQEMMIKLNNAMEIKTEIYGDINPMECTHASISLLDHLGMDRVESAKPENRVTQVVDFPGTTCRMEAINFYLYQPIAEMTASRINFYGADIMVETINRLNNYAAYGTPTPPDLQFPPWIMGGLYTTGSRTISLDGTAAYGVPLKLNIDGPSEIWKLPVSRGYIQHDTSKLCMQPSADVSYAELDACNGLPNQVWIREGQQIRHEQTGVCLSSFYSAPSTPWGAGIAYPLLHLRPCNGARDQIWYTYDPHIPGPN